MADVLYRRSAEDAGFSPGAPNSDGNGGYSFRSFVPRLLESLFSRPFLTSLPIVVFAALGVLSARSAQADYVSTGVLSVSKSTLLADLANVGSTDAFSWETQAALTSKDINELLGTNEFAMNVANGADLASALESGLVNLATIRQSVAAYPSGTNLVTIRVATDNPELSFRLASSTIESFTQWVIDGEITESTAAEAFFDGRLEIYEADLNDARDALAAYDGPETSVELSRLNDEVDLATARYASALQKSEDAKLSTETATSNITQRLRVVDVPQMPFAPESSRKAMVLTIATFIVVGMLFAIGFVVAGAVLDRSVRYVGDVQSRLNLDVLAVVPAVPR
ncbi:MAG: hypothetical protein M3P52_07390 [Actinomycetota bacterium]|nr:hypothetical protein [Actinomycetota bacterium]